jgi:LIM domain kinase 1
MLKGNKYDEKVDVFSFGIIMCEIIGRIQADPDFMPRTDDFGLNQQKFIETFCKSDDPCPEIFYQIAFHCCDLNPDRRPSFKILAEWFDRIAIHGAILGNHHHPPTDLKWEIRQFRGDVSTCNTPEVNETPPDFSIVSPKTQSNCVESKTPSPEKEKVPLPEILCRSPHLAKDFAPNGDRIRDSWRARRKQKIRENGLRTTTKKTSLNNISPTEVHKKPPTLAAAASKT